MPGRGQPWKEGGHVDDTILGEDIKDGTIQEVDLDSALQAKVNSGGHTIQDEGTPITNQSNLNFIGTGVTAVFGAEDTTTVTIPGGTGHIIEDEGTPLIDRPDLNFVGAGVTVTDDGETAKTIVTIPSGADGVGYDEVQDEGTPLVKRLAIDFKGAGVTVTDDGELTKTIVTIPSGGINRENVADPFTDFYLYDEFFYPTPSTGLSTHYEKAGTFSAPTDKIGGQVQFATSTVANNVTRINTCGAGLASLDPTKNFRQVWRVQALQAGTDIAILLGFYRDQGSKPGGTFPWGFLPADFAFFQRDGTGNWFAKISDGITPTSIDTGVISDQVFHVFEIRSNPLLPNIEFLIDNVVKATFTVNLPNNNLASFAGIQTGAAFSKSMIVDSFYLFQER